jgi:hypothetical protein
MQTLIWAKSTAPVALETLRWWRSSNKSSDRVDGDAHPEKGESETGRNTQECRCNAARLKRTTRTRNEKKITEINGKCGNGERADGGDDTDVNRCPAGMIRVAHKV